MALLTALFATALLLGLGLSIVLLGSAETTLASHDRDARALAYASKAAIAVAAADLRARPSWSALLAPGVVSEASASPGRFVDATLAPAAPWYGDPLDLRALTVRLQADSDAVTSLGGDAPIWRLFEYGSLASLVPEASASVSARNPYYLVVWVADDRGDGDGSPAADSNGIIVVRAVAYGPGEAKSITEISMSRQAVPGSPDLVRILTIRPGA
jgi:hypothetical protein